MIVRMALLADYANVSREGKLNVLGIFHNLNTASLPAQHPMMQLVLMLEGHTGDVDREQQIEIRLMAPSGKDVFKMEGAFVVGAAGDGSTVIRSQQILSIAGLTFTEEGGHIFYVYLNKHEEAAVTLDVRLVTPDEAPKQLPPGT